jgi:hypothetical protein
VARWKQGYARAGRHTPDQPQSYIIQYLAKADDGSLRVLDLTDPDVRAAVLAFEGAKVSALYDSVHSRPFI